MVAELHDAELCKLNSRLLAIGTAIETTSRPLGERLSQAIGIALVGRLDHKRGSPLERAVKRVIERK
jgi:hypothetical protein